MAAAVVLLLALSWGGRYYGWLSAQIVGLLVLSALFWGLFAWRLTAVDEPFLPLNILANQVVRCAALAGACSMSVLVGLTIFLPLYFETVLHFSASQSGTALIPMTAATVVFSTSTGRAMVYVERYKWMAITGLCAAIAALVPLAIWPGTMPVTLVLVWISVIGAGLGRVIPSST
eukprot:gene64396-88079_t